MFIEVLFGIYSKSLGLVTDGAHMLLDCTAIIIGVYCSYISHNGPNNKFNFGYVRSEVIGTFINSVFLIFIALYIVLESLERFIQPRHIHSDHLIHIAIFRLVINIIGVLFLREFYGHHLKNDKSHHLSDHKYVDVEKAENEITSKEKN